MAASNPVDAIFALSTAYWPSRCLHVAAEIGVADVLGDEPQTADALAAALGLQAQPLGRVLRALANEGIFEMRRDGAFAHNAASRLLASNARPSLRSLVRMMGLKMHWAAYAELEAAVRTGAQPMVEAVGAGLFDRLHAYPDEGRIFDEAMTGKAVAQVAPTIAAYDFTPFATIGDIGGGAGHLLAAVLDAAPAANGVLFDLPAVVERSAQAAHPRIRYVGGDFFKDPIPACDAYLIMTVLHDWSDAEAIRILSAIRRSAAPGAKLLVVECVVGEIGESYDFGAHLDVEMLAVTTGRERTREEWVQVLEAGGFELSRVIPTDSWSSIIEAEPA